jgi:MFS family permease
MLILFTRTALIVQIPFGIVADHYGRRPVLFLAISVLAIYTTFGVAVRKWRNPTLGCLEDS